jgi:hypothetical protein
MTTMISDEGTEESIIRGWFYETKLVQGFSGIDTGWHPESFLVKVHPYSNNDSADSFRFVFEWDFTGSFNPLIDIDERQTSASTKVHLCENTSVSLVVRDNAEREAQMQLLMSMRSDDGCEKICDGDIDNCPFDGSNKAPPADDTCLTTGQVPDVGNPTDDPCIGDCIDDFYQCMVDTDCNVESCYPAYNSCVSTCLM